MTINAVQNNTGQQTSSSTSSTTGSSTVDKEAFLKLLLAQLQYQDPLSPMDGTEFVSQLATFTNVEQSIAQSEQLELISLQLTGIASNEAIGLIGKEVTIRGNAISFDGSSSTGFSANLEDPASEVTVTIRDSSGQAVRTITMGAQPAGTLAVQWDGADDNGKPAAAGNYTVEVSARDEAGSPVEVTQDVTGRVVGVSFDKGYPEVELDSGATAPISDLIEVKSVI